MESAIESVQKLGVLLIGKTGNGKNSAGNKLLGKNVFKVGTGLSPVTKTEESGEIQIFGKILKVFDTPDITNLPDSKLSKAEAEAIIHKWKSMITSMPYIVLLAIKCNEEYSQTEFAIYQQIKQMWGDNSLCQGLVVLFTFGDRQGENFCGELQTCTSPLRDVLRDAGERYLIFSKKIHETRDLFHQFDNLCLSSPLQSMDQKDAPVVTGLSSSWESRGQNEVTVVTGFVSSSLELMDQNDTAVSTGLSSTLKTMDQINDTVLTGLPTLESMDQNDATVLTDLSTTESGDKNDASISTGLSSTLKSRDQKVANVSTGLSSTLESIDHSDSTVSTGLSSALESMDHSDSTVSTGLSSTLESKNQNDAIILCEGTLCDRDQQSLNFACADDKAHPFQEAIECGFTPLSMNEECFQGSERSQDDASRPDPSQSDTQEELCLLVIGKTGNGKSTGGNLLLNKHLFNTGVGLSSTTTTTQTGTGSFEGRNFKVIDTPDVFNQEMCKEDQKKEIEKWKQMVLPEPYAILLAVRCDVRYSPEEFRLYQLIKELWGKETFCKHLVVLFTFGDRADREIEQELKTVCQELKNVLKDAEWRYIVLSEKADFKSTQNEIKKLFNKLVKSDKDTLTSLSMPKKMKFPNILPKFMKGN